MNNTLVFYPIIMKDDNRWYVVAKAPFFLTPKAANDAARVEAKNKNYKQYGVKNVEVVLDENGAIIS